MITFNEILIQNTKVSKWFNLLDKNERNYLIPIFDQVLATTNYYNSLFNGFEVYITGSSLNLVEPSYNDIDLMVVVPNEEIRKIRIGLLNDFRGYFKNIDSRILHDIRSNPKIQILRLDELFSTIIDSINYVQEILTSNNDALMKRHGSSTAVTRIMLDPEQEIESIKVRLDGTLEAEKHVMQLEPDGAAGFQLGHFVENFLENVATNLKNSSQNGQQSFSFQWHKSFSEGYGKVAGENNCYIFTKNRSIPVHLFLTTGNDNKKAMEKKESFMIEYYSDHERMLPIKIL